MSPTSTQISARRTAKTAAIGAAALTAVVALPAFALDRGGDGAVESVTAAAAVPGTSASTSTSTSTTIDPALDAFLKQQAQDNLLAWLAALTPEQQFHLAWYSSSPEQQAAFAAYAAEQEAFRLFVEARLAEAAQAKAAAASLRRPPGCRPPGQLLGRRRLGSSRPVRDRRKLGAPHGVGRLLRRPDVPLRHLERDGWPGLRPHRRTGLQGPADRHRREDPGVVGLGCLAGGARESSASDSHRPGR